MSRTRDNCGCCSGCCGCETLFLLTLLALALFCLIKTGQPKRGSQSVTSDRTCCPTYRSAARHCP